MRYRGFKIFVPLFPRSQGIHFACSCPNCHVKTCEGVRVGATIGHYPPPCVEYKIHINPISDYLITYRGFFYKFYKIVYYQ
jgi:hypothetical protein